jgi:hypothetical protein
MFSFIKIENGQLSALKPVAKSATEANKMLQQELNILYSELVNPLASPEVKIEYEAGLAKLVDGSEFVVKNLSSSSSTSSGPPPTETKSSSDLSPSVETKSSTSKLVELNSWKKYKKSTLVIPGGWLVNEVKTPKSDFVADYQIVQHNLDYVTEFVDNLRIQEEAKSREERKKEAAEKSSAALNMIKQHYAIDASKPSNCIAWNDACDIGRLIRDVMSEEDCESLLTWSLSNSTVPGVGVRADLLNLAAYVYRHHTYDEQKAQEYFRAAAALNYPLAMTNLVESHNIDLEEKANWIKIINDLGYKCTF